LDHRFEFPCLNQDVYFFKVTSARLHLDHEEGFPTEQSLTNSGNSPGNCWAKKLHTPCRCMRSGEGKRNVLPFRAKNGEGTAPDRLANAIEHYTVTGKLILAHLACVIDYLIGSKLGKQFVIPFAGSARDKGPKAFRNLNSEYAHPACGRMDQHPAARLDSAVSNQSLPCGCCGQRNYGG